jgi:uncharacterized protein YkwD
VAPDRHDSTDRDRHWSGRTLWAVCAAGAAASLLAGFLLVPSSSPRTVRPADSAPSIGTVQTLYSQDLLARINAERAARNSAAQPIPALAVDPGLAAAAQSWSAQLASTGVVQDPALAGCGSAPTATQVCEFASNSGTSGNGPWPGDGSDGMESAYMSSPGHRQNMLDAGYDQVGIGVTCGNGQAWTVEVFGYAYGNIGSAQSRQAAQSAVAGNPVPPVPAVAGTQTGDPVYCPGQTIGPNGQTTSTGGQYPYLYPYAAHSVPGEPDAATAVGIAAAAGDQGYWVAKSDGSVNALGSAPDFGSMAGHALAFPVVQIESTPDGGGYWEVGADGGIFAFGDAAFFGSTGAIHLNAPIVGMAPTADGRGYWEVGADGGIFAYGDAAFMGSTGALHLNAPIVGMAPTPDGHGYRLVGADGGIFAFGEAAFLGSTGALHLNAPVVGMAPTPDGRGYWLVGSDGGIFAFGDAPFQGSTGSLVLQAPITGIAADKSTRGYWMVGSDGGVFAFAAPFAGTG